MLELIKTEYFRHKKWLFITAALNTLLIFSGIYFDDYEQSGTAVGLGFTLIMGINALLLGLSQMKTYRPTNMWTFLINRPVKPRTLCLGLLTAGAAIILSAWVLPYVLLTLMVDLLDIYIIDWRHYLQAVYLLLMAMCWYLTGCYISLSNNKTAYTSLVFPLLIMSTLMSSGAVLWVAGISVLWLLLLLLGVFKANLANEASGAIQTVGRAIPFHLMAFLVLSVGTAFTYQVYLMLVDGAGIRVAWNYYFAADTYDYLSYAAAEEQLQLGVSAVADAHYLQRQIKGSGVDSMTPALAFYPWQQQLPYLQDYQQLSLLDQHHDIQWVFSHDSMSFLGRDANNSRGMLGAGELRNEAPDFIANVVFETVPVVLGQQVITQQDLYQYDPYLARLQTKFTVPENETLLSGLVTLGSYEVVLSTAKLYVFDPQSNAAAVDMLQPLSQIPLPQAHENLTAVALATMMDRQILGFLYGKQSAGDQYQAMQVVYQLNHDHSHQLLTQRPLVQGFSVFYRHRDFYLSPLWHVLYDGWLSPLKSATAPQVKQHWQLPHMPKRIWVLLMVLTATSLLLTYAVLRRRQVNRYTQFAQLLVVALTNLPGLLFCWLYYPVKPPIQDKPKG